jgi:hypothetical protein
MAQAYGHSEVTPSLPSILKDHNLPIISVDCHHVKIHYVGRWALSMKLSPCAHFPVWHQTSCRLACLRSVTSQDHLLSWAVICTESLFLCPSRQ